MHALTWQGLALLCGLVMCAGAPALAQKATPLRSSALALDTLLKSPGPSWRAGRSAHFVVHVERSLHSTSPAVLLDSLEAAWTNAVNMLGVTLTAGTPIHVLVTASRTRFPRLLSPVTKGLVTPMPNGGDVIILVMNDSVRPYARHEVMHVVSRRAWGSLARDQVWLTEGLATLADGRCQGTTTIAVARDLLHIHPTISADDVTTRFVALREADRGLAYVLASSFVGFIWEGRGRDGVRRLWEGADSLGGVPLIPGIAVDLTSPWRAYVDRAAASAPGLDTVSFRRFACG